MARPHPDIGGAPVALSIEALSWGPDPSRPILRDIDLDVTAGEMLAIVGPNGAGKSSLLRCLYRLHRPTAGRVRLDGADIWTLRPRDVARRMATVLQEPITDFGLSVAEIVVLGLTPHAGRLDRASRTRAIDEALDIMGLEALAGRNFAALSGGEKQRVMIARALAQKPDILILDEPTNHLDIRHQLDILHLLARLPATVVVTLHDLALAAAHADRVLILEHGRVSRCGPPLDVLTPATIRQTFAVEVLADSHPATGRPRFSFHLGPDV